MNASSVTLLRNSFTIALIFVLTVLIGTGYILQQRFEYQSHSRQYQVSRRLASTTTKPVACPKSDILTYTDSMEELSQLRPLFSFSLTPWAMQYDWDKNRSDPDVRWSMIVMVKSHSNNVWARRIVRMTWAGLDYYDGVIMKTIFIVGKAENPKAEYELLKENEKYGDLLQLDRKEKYKDVVFKTLAGMQYAGSHFPCDWIYVSADDDIMPDLKKIHEEVENFIIKKDNIVAEGRGSCRGSSSLKILCGWNWVKAAQTHRGEKSKWFISLKDYPHKLYPPYCKGPWYSMRILHAKELYSLARIYPVLWIDDVWITGTLRLKHIRNDEHNLCPPTDLTWGLVNQRSVTMSSTLDDLIQSWILYFKKHFKPLD